MLPIFRVKDYVGLFDAVWWSKFRPLPAVRRAGPRAAGGPRGNLEGTPPVGPDGRVEVMLGR